MIKYSNVAITGSINVTGSLVVDGVAEMTASNAVSASFATTAVSASYATTAPQETYNIPDSNTTSWVFLGTLDTGQTGHTMYMKVMSHRGYNAIANQPQVTEFIFNTSNNIDFQAGSSGNFYAVGLATANSRLGTGGPSGNEYESPSTFRIVQVSNTQYQIYGLFEAFGAGLYTLNTMLTDTWSHSGTISGTPSGNFVDVSVTNY